MGPFDSTAWMAPLGSPWVIAPAAFVLWVAVLWIVQRVLVGALRRVSASTRWVWDDAIAGALPTPLFVAILASGLVLVERILPLQPEWDRALDIVLIGGFVLAFVLFTDRFASGVMDRLTPSSPVLQGARGLLMAGVRALIAGLGLLVFLDSIGISITPILASLGVGSLAVALALQETLANLVAGIYMVVDKPIEPGHFIRLPTGEEGVVIRVGWRSTWIRMPTNSVVVVPNAKLAGSNIVNHDLPDRELAVVVPVGVHYDSDLDRVERVTLEVAAEVMRSVPGGVASFQPLVRFSGFGDSAIQFNAVLRAASFDATHLVKHQFLKRLADRFRREGIVIPYPIRTLDLPAGSFTAGSMGAGPSGAGPARPPRA
ncbi:MAG: mechanosensitive ion channel family protein [Candidatus Polarisedimenticolia bacterium]